MTSLRDKWNLWEIIQIYSIFEILEVYDIFEIYEIFVEKMKYLWQMRSIRSLKFNSIKINYLSGELHTILSIFITHFLNNVITNWSVLYNIFFNIFCLTNLKIKNIELLKKFKSKLCTYSIKYYRIILQREKSIK